MKLVSMHSSEGLELERVFIPAIDTMSGAGDEAANEAKLLYLTMTRATERLVMTCAGQSELASRIDEVVGGLAGEGLAA
jgi:superfamily I DNA/RNA helicase